MLYADSSTDIECIAKISSQSELHLANRAFALDTHRMADIGIHTQRIGRSPLVAQAITLGIDKPTIVGQDTTPIV